MRHLKLSDKIAMLINTDRWDGSADLAPRQAIRPGKYRFHATAQSSKLR